MRLSTRPALVVQGGPEKERWEANHVCPINFAGSAPAMEQEGVGRIFLRSAESRHLQYTGYIGDGDSKAFSQVNSLRPYGGKSITKIECVGHVQKRMRTALPKLKSAKGKQKLSDGKTIGGASRLTGALIEKLQICYGLSICRNKDNLKKVHDKVWGGLFHSASTDKHPQHQYCPKGPDTWCKFYQDQENGIQHSHKKEIADVIVQELIPIYRRLSSK